MSIDKPTLAADIDAAHQRARVTPPIRHHKLDAAEALAHYCERLLADIEALDRPGDGNIDIDIRHESVVKMQRALTLYRNTLTDEQRAQAMADMQVVIKHHLGIEATS